MPHKDKEVRKNYNKQYYENQKENILENKKAYYQDNKEEIKKNKRTYNKEQRKIIRDRLLKKFYGINLEQYNIMLENQKGICAICSEPPSAKKALAVDHCHITGKIRSLLCSRCNLAIGMFQEDNELMFKALEYLKKHNINDNQSDTD